MRPPFVSVILVVTVGLAGTCFAQWRHFGETASQVAAGKPTVSPQNELARDMLARHNAVRARVGTAPLVWSQPLAVVAQNWANKLIATGQFAHSHNPNYGENLFEIMSAAATPTQVVDSWADEVRDYDYSSNTCRASAMCGHYTQVVWSDTKELGCAVTRGAGKEIWVCEYNPPGNWTGRKPY